ncbi:hypothetical protein SAMN02745121_00798 [Nannocystis exedens]|uniref:Uncharacterized protein n=1 Tax=Nannocystis exedens TaxID=54 RepID=A0A1I1TM18_9BACT|nr:hypothetical protein [Nannocystis exedens]PCC66438.1 hypothetical protein NAEX_09026 [Nannocystis exedens]SFD59574.1 hypothetical protein SAMN02745121_00798 [Nannocystis exedens]
MTRPSLLLASLALLGCSTGDDPGDSGSNSNSGLTTASVGTDPSTTDVSTTTGTSTDPAPTTSDGTTTGDDPTTTSTTTTGSTTDETTGTTGPICDPGQVNCVCDGDACADGLECVDGMCVPVLVCDGDLGEPDDTEPNAQDLGEINDDDDNTVMADGVLSGAGDVDWYTYHGLDEFGHVAEPTVKVTSSTTVRVCQFIECDQGGAVGTEITCPEGTQTALSGALRPGCCGGATFTVADFNCSGSSDDIQVYVRLDKPSQDECVEYSLVSHN